MSGQELREIHTTWLEQKEEEGEQRDVAENEEHKGKEEEETVMAVEVPAEVKTPVAFVSQDLAIAAIDIDIPSSTLQGVKPPSILYAMESSPEAFDTPATAISSPTLSIFTVSDLTPTELGEERTTVRHETFYFEDGNVEIVCGDTVFRVHSTTISFSSSKLRDMLSPSTLLNAPTPEGCPRVVFTDSTEDFETLLKMIYTPGYVHSMWILWTDRFTADQIPGKEQGSRICGVRFAPSDGDQVRFLRRTRTTHR